MAYNLPVRIGFYRAQYYTEGRTDHVRALVNHRMVGYVAGTRSYFQHPNRPVSTHFGIGIIGGKLVIDQYVPLDDTAFGNGNYDATGVWDDWGYPVTGINAQTINIEHQDHGDPKGVGVVSPVIQEASKSLQALLLRGSLDDWKRNGVILRDWTHNGPILKRELNALVPGPRTIITHHDIAGKLKPNCWMPWMNDKIGFPRTAYITGINTIIKAQGQTPQPPIPQPPTGVDMRPFTLLEKPAGYLTTKGAGHYYLDLHSDKLVGPLADGWPGTPKRAYPARLDKPIDGDQNVPNEARQVGYLVPVGPAFFLAADVNFVSDVDTAAAADELRAIADKLDGG